MRIKFIPENDADRLELGLITPEELGKEKAEESINKFMKGKKRC